LEDASAPQIVEDVANAEPLSGLVSLQSHDTYTYEHSLEVTIAAVVLGHPDRHAVDPERAFADLGFDSLTGVELRNRLSADTGLTVSRTAIFDYPSPAALADHLADQMLHGRRTPDDDETIRSLLAKISIHELRRTGLLDQLLVLAGESERLLADQTVSDDTIDSLSPDALIAMALDSGERDDVEQVE
jgi:acyl carrier protein